MQEPENNIPPKLPLNEIIAALTGGYEPSQLRIAFESVGGDLDNPRSPVWAVLPNPDTHLIAHAIFFFQGRRMRLQKINDQWVEIWTTRQSGAAQPHRMG